MNKTILAFIAGLMLIPLLGSSYASDHHFRAYVYPGYGYGTYVCGYNAWGYPQYCSSYGYGYGYPYAYRYYYPWRHHHHHHSPWRY